ncbi:hypothetical protein ACNRWW_18500 [Metabacillus sp. HB246100]
MDKTNKFVASLNYFSVFFAPFLLPIAIYFIADHHEVKEHAKKALISHIVPFLIDRRIDHYRVVQYVFKPNGSYIFHSLFHRYGFGWIN